MSSSIWWEPPPSETKRHYLDLKYELGRHLEEDYNGGNGSWTVDADLIPYLQGIAQVGDQHHKRDANELIAAIKKYGKVIITIS